MFYEAIKLHSNGRRVVTLIPTCTSIFCARRAANLAILSFAIFLRSFVEFVIELRIIIIVVPSSSILHTYFLLLSSLHPLIYCDGR